MTEVLMGIDLAQRVERLQTPTIDPTANKVLGELEWLKMMRVHAAGLQTASDEWLASRVMDADGRSIVRADEFGGSRRALHLTIGKVGRSPHRDPFELNKTTLKVASVVAKLSRREIAYMKTRSEVPGEEPQYALGKIIGTLIAVEPDPPKRPRVVVYVQTRSLLNPNGIKESKLFVDDIAAQFDKRHGDTGPDTPSVIVGRRAVRKCVERAYKEPRAIRKACGNDSPDILEALCISGARVVDLGVKSESADQLQEQAIAGLKRVCSQGATYKHEILMLPPLCNSLDEALNIIDSICGGRTVEDIHPELGDEHRLLASLRTR